MELVRECLALTAVISPAFGVHEEGWVVNGKERVAAMLGGQPADRVGFWLGNPADETKEIYCRHFGIICKDASPEKGEDTEESVLLTTTSGRADVDLAAALDSDLFWCSPELDPAASYKHPQGTPMWDVLGGRPRESLSQPGMFAQCEDVRQVEAFDWPNPDHLDFTSTIDTIDYAASKGMAVFGGMWMPFFHVVADFFGMENYFVKMHTHPKIVEAVTEHVLEFYLEANRRCLDAMRPKLDAQFFGNDLGSQQDLLISPAAFRRFVLPGIKRIIDQAKSYDLKVAIHSCGAVSKILPELLDAGADALHPLQARAAGMDAESLARQFKGRLLFIGGVDTQQLLPFGTSRQVTNEVRRLKELFAPRYVVSPSHEALLPNVSLQNVIAMRDAALK